VQPVEVNGPAYYITFPARGIDMAFRNYVYVSKRKLDVYFPQVKWTKTVERTAELKLKGGPVEAGISEKQATIESSHSQIEEFISHLRAKGQLGTIQSHQEWFEGDFLASSVMDGGLFFGGSVDDGNGKPLDLVLLASREHMIGSEYHKERDDYFSQTETVGPTETRQYNINSNNYMFGHTLSKLFSVEHLSNTIDTPIGDGDSIVLEKYRLTDNEISFLEQSKTWNSQVFNILRGEEWHVIQLDFGGLFGGPPLPRIPGSLKEKILNLIRRPVARYAIGQELFNRKKDALKRKFVFDNLQKNSLEIEEREILRSAHSFMVNRRGRGIHYEFLARRLLEGYRIEPAQDLMYASRPPEDQGYISRIVIASPMYLAIKSRF
jgi:hypothetical protein